MSHNSHIIMVPASGGYDNIDAARRGRIRRFFANFFPLRRRRSQLKRLEKNVIRRLNFSKSEIRALGDEIEAIKQDGPWVTIRGIKFPMPGHIFRLSQKARYRLLERGSIVLVQNLPLSKTWWVEKEVVPEALCVSLDRGGRFLNGKMWPIRISDLEEVVNEDAYFQNWHTPPKEHDIFRDGDLVETVDEILLGQEDDRGAMASKLPRGFRGIVDSPAILSGNSLDDINSPYARVRNATIITAITVINEKSTIDINPKELVIPYSAEGEKHNIYFPSLREHIQLHSSQIRRRGFDRDVINSVILDNETREQILSLVNGSEEDLKKWGVSSFQKGTGRIFLAYGPPGTGKTLTGEMLAEYLGRPLYVVNSADLGFYGHSFEIKLREVIERTARWNAVTIIDEAELILQSRDLMIADSILRVTAVLRSLERLERGIIWFTTNRPLDIDFAIESRIRAQIYFPFPDAERREKLWRVTLPDKMEVEGIGEQMFKELAEVVLDGREIKNAIQNAADMASSNKLKIVPASCLLTAAKIISRNKERMAEAKQSGGRNLAKRPGQYL